MDRRTFLKKTAVGSLAVGSAPLIFAGDGWKGANDQALARADIREGFYSCALIHLANVSCRLGRSLDFDPDTMRFPGDAEANAMLTKAYREAYVIPDKV